MNRSHRLFSNPDLVDQAEALSQAHRDAAWARYLATRPKPHQSARDIVAQHGIKKVFGHPIDENGICK